MMGAMFDLLRRLFPRDLSEKRADPRQCVRIPVRALVGVELKLGQVHDLSSRGARLRLQGMRKAAAWIIGAVCARAASGKAASSLRMAIKHLSQTCGVDRNCIMRYKEI